MTLWVGNGAVLKSSSQLNNSSHELYIFKSDCKIRSDFKINPWSKTAEKRIIQYVCPFLHAWYIGSCIYLPINQVFDRSQNLASR